MAINPDNITTIRVDQLPEDVLSLVNEFAHTNGTELKKATIQSLVDLVAAAVGAGSGVGFLPISVTDGQQLPDVPAEPSFFLAGIGTFLNINGYPDLICTEELNAIMSLTDHWEIAVEIPIAPLSGAVQSVTGSAVDNTDPLNPIINSTGGGATPTLQEVTDVGSDTTNAVGSTSAFYVGAFFDWLSGNTTAQFMAMYADLGMVIKDYGPKAPMIFKNKLNDNTITLLAQNKPESDYLIADTEDIAALQAQITAIPTNTSDLINDGEDGVHPYITLLDLPSNLILYPTTVASDVVGYVKLVTDIHDVDYNVTAVDVSTGSITTTNQLISSLITVPDLISGNPGVFNISTVGNIRRSAGSGTAEFYFNVYKRDGAGTETLIGTSNPTLPPSSAVYAEFNSTAIWDDGVFTATDRIVLKFYGSRIAGGSNPTYEFQFGGTTPVRTLVPIPLSVVPSIPNATETVAGIAEIATTAEVATGADDTRIVTPLKLKQVTDNYMQVILNCNVLGTTVNGGTNIVLYQVDVPANTFSDLDAFEIEGLSAKVGVTAASTIRIWTDTASTFNSGTAQLLAVSASLGATNLYQTLKREFHVRGATLKCLANTVGVATDEATAALSANTWASYTFNPAVANTLYFTVTGNAADTFTKQNYKITRYKNKSTI